MYKLHSYQFYVLLLLLSPLANAQAEIMNLRDHFKSSKLNISEKDLQLNVWWVCNYYSFQGTKQIISSEENVLSYNFVLEMKRNPLAILENDLLAHARNSLFALSEQGEGYNLDDTVNVAPEYFIKQRFPSGIFANSGVVRQLQLRSTLAISKSSFSFQTMDGTIVEVEAGDLLEERSLTPAHRAYGEKQLFGGEHLEQRVYQSEVTGEDVAFWGICRPN